MGIVLTFNQLLPAGGLAPEAVRLLRHRDPKPRIHRALYDAAMKGDPKFAQYQERQGTPQVIEHFRHATYLAGFVAEPDDPSNRVRRDLGAPRRAGRAQGQPVRTGPADVARDRVQHA